MSKRTSILFKSYKSKITAILAGSLLALSLFSCANNADDENGSVTGGNAAQNSEAYQNALKMQKRLSMYEKILGTWVPDTESVYHLYFEEDAFFDKITIEWGSVTLNGTKYTVDSSDLYLSGELDRSVAPYPDDDLVIKVGTNYISFDSCLFGETKDSTAKCNPNDIIIYAADGKKNMVGFTFKKATSSSGSGDSGTGDTSALKGTYAFTTARVDSSHHEVNGNLILSDNGTWSLSGGKTNAAASSGTWSVSGSKVTVNWTANSLNLSEVFTVTTNGTASTWTSDNAVTSTFLTMLFGVQSLEISFTKS